MLYELLRRLRAVDPGATIDELRDILWLAEQLPSSGAAPGGKAGQADGPPDSEQADATAPEKAQDSAAIGPGENSADPAAVEAGGDEGARTALFADQSVGTVNASTLRVPGVASTDHPQDMRRELRPFGRRVPSRWKRRLDEDETAERAVGTRVWLPVYAPTRERWFELSVVVESSASMALWEDTLAEFVRLLRNQGGFRSVTAYRLDDDVGRELGSADGRHRHPLSRLLHREHPHLLLFVSDAISARWRNGAVHAFLSEASAAASVAVLQPLPPRAWQHTAVGETDIKLYAESPGDINADLKALLPWWVEEADASGALRVPVVALDAADIGRWARMVTAHGGAGMPGVLLSRFRAAPAEAAQAQQAAAPQPVDPAERVARFRSMVSAEAYELAVFLSVPDPLTVPVMRLVQRTMLPATGTAVLAEFLEGGLLVRMDGLAAPGEGEAWYRFIEGVREELTQSLRYSEESVIKAQLQKVGRFLEQQDAGEGGGFNAYFPTPAGRHRITEWSLPFASVSKGVLVGRGPGAGVVSAAETASVEEPAPMAEPVAPPASTRARGPVSLRIELRTDEVLVFTLVRQDLHTEVRMGISQALLGRLRQADEAVALSVMNDVLRSEPFSEGLESADGLTLVVEGALERIRWEYLVRSDPVRPDSCLALSVPCVRQDLSPQHFVIRDASIRPLAWVIGDPRGAQPALPQAQAEAMEVAALLQRLAGEFDIETDIGGGADLAQRLRAGPFRMLFVSGHGVQSISPDGTMRTGVQYGQGHLLELSDMLAQQPPPEFVFLACNYLASLAPALLKAGVSAVVAAYDVVDERSDFPRHVFEAMVVGKSFGEAVLAARRETFEARGDASWAQYQCFGSPDYKLVPEGFGLRQMRGEADAPAVHEADPRRVPPKADPALEDLLDACVDVPNSKVPSGVQMGVRFGDDLALTCAQRSEESRYYLSEADAAKLPYQIDELWNHVLELARSRGADAPLHVDRLVESVAERESAARLMPQLLALSGKGPAHRQQQRRLMMLHDEPIRGTLEAEVVYYMGQYGVRCEVTVRSEHRAGLLHLARSSRPSSSSSTWPLPPDANGAPVISEGRCIGMVAGFSADDGVIAKDARTLRAALQAAWCIRLHAGLQDHARWFTTRGSSASRLSLAAADFGAIDLRNADLREARLPSARLSGANLRSARLDKAWLKFARMDGASLEGAVLAGADLTDADLRGAHLGRADFSKAVLNGVNFKGAAIEGCIWQGARFKDTKFDRSHITDANLRKALKVSHERFLQMVAAEDDAPADGHPLAVIRAFDLRASTRLSDDARYRFLAAGDSWFAIDPGAASGSTSLLHSLAFSERTEAIDCTLRRNDDPRASDFPANRELMDWLAVPRHEMRLDAILLSIGGDDLFEAARALPLVGEGQPTPREERLLLLPDEWQPSATGIGERYVSVEGADALARYLHARFDALIRARDAGAMRGRPVFLHGYADPMPRPAPTRDDVATLQSVLGVYRIPIEHHWPVAQALMSLLRRILQGIADNPARFPAVHYFDSSGVKLERASANWRDASGDWEDELHPTAEGYAKLARAWGEYIEAVALGPGSGRTMA